MKRPSNGGLVALVAQASLTSLMTLCRARDLERYGGSGSKARP